MNDDVEGPPPAGLCFDYSSWFMDDGSPSKFSHDNARTLTDDASDGKNYAFSLDDDDDKGTQTTLFGFDLSTFDIVGSVFGKTAASAFKEKDDPDEMAPPPPPPLERGVSFDDLPVDPEVDLDAAVPPLVDEDRVAPIPRVDPYNLSFSIYVLSNAWFRLIRNDGKDASMMLHSREILHPISALLSFYPDTIFYLFSHNQHIRCKVLDKYTVHGALLRTVIKEQRKNRTNRHVHKFNDFFLNSYYGMKSG